MARHLLLLPIGLALFGSCQPHREPGPPADGPGQLQAPTAMQSPGGSADADHAACAVDAECTFVSLGCCSTTPVNRKYVQVASEALSASGKPYCPVKAACGPGGDGTWAGTPGRCLSGRCGCDPTQPLVDNCRQ